MLFGLPKKLILIIVFVIIILVSIGYNNDYRRNNTNSGLIDAEYKKKIPVKIRNLDLLKGIKVGSANQGGTLYIMIDPQCPASLKAYQELKPYIDRGATVKWIPVSVLGQRQLGLSIANAILHAENRQELDEIMSNPKMHTKKLTQADWEALERNIDFFNKSFKYKKAYVPVAFFLDANGKYHMMDGISNAPIIEKVLGKQQ